MINNIFPFSDFLYLLQIEEYDSMRYFKLLSRFFFRRNFQKRQKLVYTKRVKTTFALSIAITLLFVPLLFFLALLLIPIWIFLANLIVDPFYSYIKQKLQDKASRYFKDNFKGKVIAVAGSYGKTTTKNNIHDLIKYSYKTQLIPGNINTPTGIANWTLNKLDTKTEILIVEMDSYFIGEIKRSCNITPPDIAILINIGDQHLERFKTRMNLQKALLEVFIYSNENAQLIFPKNIKTLINKTGNRRLISLNNPSNLDFALKIAELLNIPRDIVSDTIKKLRPPDRRHNKITLYGFETIDDSYNISFTTAVFGLKSAINEAKAKNKKLIVITGGIPELGKENKEANIEFGKLLSKQKVEIVLMKTILHKDVLMGLNKNVELADGMTDAWESIQKKYNKDKYLILMQPELGDNYY